MAKITTVRERQVSYGAPFNPVTFGAASSYQNAPAILGTSSRCLCRTCDSMTTRGLVCVDCAHKAQKAADIMANGMGHPAGRFTRKDGLWELRMGSYSWTSAEPFTCALNAIRFFEAASRHHAGQVQDSAKHLRSNSTAQKEYDRLQDIVSRAIGALGVELQYA